MSPNMDLLSELHYASRDPQYDDGKAVCEWCGCEFDADEAVSIGRFDCICPDCAEEVREDQEEDEDEDN